MIILIIFYFPTYCDFLFLYVCSVPSCKHICVLGFSLGVNEMLFSPFHVNSFFSSLRGNAVLVVDF